MPVYRQSQQYPQQRGHSKKQRNTFSWRKIWMFCGVPVLFCVLSIAAIALIAMPTVRPYIGLVSYFFSENHVDAQPSNLYESLGQQIQNSTTVAWSTLVYPNKGDQYGKITVEGTNVNAPLYYGDSTRELNRGVATYGDSGGAGIPGENRTVLLAGHNNTFFSGLQDAKKGALVHIDTHYGSYVYRITDMKVAEYTDTTTYDFTRTDENLIMYTCYPFDAIGFTSQRYFVYAEYVSGPMIDKQQ